MAASTVPSSGEIELASYQFGSFSSDLDVIETRVEKLLEPMTVEEYVSLDDSELKAKLATLPSPTVEEVMPLLVFAVDLEHDAHELVARAAGLRTSVLALVHEAEDSDFGREGKREAYRARIAAWHAEAAEHYGATS